MGLKENRNADLQVYLNTILFTVWELRWPELASETAKSRNDVLSAMEELQQAQNEEIEVGIVKKYAYLPIIKKIQADRMFFHSYRALYKIKYDLEKKTNIR